MQFNKSDAALVVIDPQNDVLSEKGVSWSLVGQSVKENNTVEHLAQLFTARGGWGFRGLRVASQHAAGSSNLLNASVLQRRRMTRGRLQSHIG
jgi:hypothetical protein